MFDPNAFILIILRPAYTRPNTFWKQQKEDKTIVDKSPLIKKSHEKKEKTNQDHLGQMEFQHAEDLQLSYFLLSQGQCSKQAHLVPFKFVIIQLFSF